ncbi:MAG: S-layer homology domain-containing protein [Bacillota bacterium]
MKIFRHTITLALIISLLTSGTSFAAEKHWVYDELAEFKQLILPVVKTIPANEIASEAEWKSVHTAVLNEERLEAPILARDWAIMLKMILGLPETQTGQLLNMYVFGLTNDDYILREDAVGGLVKLLTLGYIKGSGSPEELKDSNYLKDIGTVSEMQDVLVRKAYCEGLLDSSVKDYFRPRDRLTNAEAASMLNKVIKKYDIHLKLNVVLSHKHWATGEIAGLAAINKNNTELVNILEMILYDDKHQNNPYIFDDPITDDNWNSILFTALNLKDSKYEKDFLEGYTYGLAENGYVPRDKAFAGMMKLLHASEKVKGRDATDEERKAAGLRFNDYNTAFDTSKLAICLSEDLVSGYTDGSFRPKQPLTNAEAVALIARILKKYN